MMTAARHQPPPDEKELVGNAKAGDREAFGVLVTRHQRRVWLVCRQYVGAEEADAASQEALIKAFTRLDAFDGRAAFSTWVTRIAINTCLDFLRKRRRGGLRVVQADGDDHSPALDIPDERAGPEEQARQRQTIARLREAEEGLSDRQREVFRLRFFAQMNLNEIADSLDVHPGTVKTLLHRAVHRLRRELGDIR
ncbi:MAG: sigma-70 family RNA polymerase sigma factor [Acidobacteriota bacterium]